MITLAMIAALAMPPKVFDHYPTAPFRVSRTAPNLIEAACGGHEPGLIKLACTKGLLIFIRTDLTPKALARVLRHEYGHINGWRHL